VFRPPRYLELLAALVGTGVQLALLVLSVILITIAGLRTCHHPPCHPQPISLFGRELGNALPSSFMPWRHILQEAV